VSSVQVQIFLSEYISILKFDVSFRPSLAPEENSGQQYHALAHGNQILIVNTRSRETGPFKVQSRYVGYPSCPGSNCCALQAVISMFVG
jgi:hypothetical protein